MALNRSSDYTNETSLSREVAFEYKNDLYKVHVNVFIEEADIIYKLYFKNNIENSDKSLMKLVKTTNDDGSCKWKCKADYFSYNNNEMAVIAGVAIDRFLDENNNKVI